MPSSKIVTIKGAQYIEVNGRVVPGAAYMTYFSDRNRYGDFAEAGYKFYSVSVFFGTNKINNIGALDCFSPGIFDNGVGDFTLFDTDVRRILDVCPDAMILPRMNVNPSVKWEQKHPDELCDKGPSAHPELVRACIASDVWAEYVKDCLTEFIKHVEASDFKENIIGYQIAGGQTEEWFSYDENGFSGERSREKYRKYLNDCGAQDSDAEYFAFLSKLCAGRIAELCSHVKGMTDGRLIVGAFYGYTLELVARTTAHHGLSLLLESDAIDFICSPISYEGYRGIGFDHVYMVPVNSHKEHGKLYFLECDSRTHISKPPFDHPRFDNPVWYGFEKSITLNSLKMHFSKCLVHGHAFWWFDMWGGWFADEDYMRFMRRAREIAEESVGLPMESLSEVAVFVDEGAYALMSDSESAEHAVRSMRLTLGRMGVPYDVYLASDFERVKNKYKAYITLVPCATPLYYKIEESARIEKKVCIRVGEENADITTDELRRRLSFGGVPIYSNRDAVIYSSESFLFFCSTQDGEQVLRLNFCARLTELFTGEEYYVSDGCLKINARLGDAFLFKICREL